MYVPINPALFNQEFKDFAIYFCWETLRWLYNLK